MGKLDNKIAIITGSNSGIGEATAKLFAKEGATVVVTGRRAERNEKVAAEIVADGGKAVAMQLDVTDSKQCDKVVDQTVEMFGRLDILVNNAGQPDFNISTKNITDEFWAGQVAVNQSGIIFMSRAAMRYMEPAKAGAVVNVSSIGGVYHCAGVAYSAGKAAILAITHNMAIQYTGQGIRFNAVCPGATATPLFEGDFSALQDNEFARITAKVIRRDVPMCDAIDQAKAILFFACDDSSAITGQYLVVDKGMCL